jgi:dTDP-L-rhamnose 4-epimerase
MADALARATEGPQPQVTGEWRAGDVRHVFASPKRAATVLGFRAEEDFEAGMREFATAELRA